LDCALSACSLMSPPKDGYYLFCCGFYLNHAKKQ
jgi:hypothetical protein